MGQRYLQEDEKVLADQRITGASNLNFYELEAQLQSRPNDRVLFLPWAPYVDLYQFGQKRYDSSKYANKIEKLKLKYDKKNAKNENRSKKLKKLRDKKSNKVDKQYKNLREGNFWMRMGEPLAVYDSIQELKSADKLTKYLHAKGYFHANVKHSIDEDFKLVTSKYKISLNAPYIIDTIYFNVPNQEIDKLLNRNQAESFIHTGENYDQSKITKERERIHDLMLNNGFYGFPKKHINFKIDTATLGNKRVALGIKINDPEEGHHHVYKIDSINFITDAEVKNSLEVRNKKSKNNITFQYYKRKYIERNLSWRTFISKDSTYSQENVFETQRQLSNVDVFKFTNISFDTVGGQFIANIYTSPLKKYQTSTEAGLKVTQGLPGPFVNASLKNRNTFKGLEILELGGHLGFEGLSGASETGSPYSSLEYGVNLSLTLPQFLAPLRYKTKQKYGRLNPKTRLSSGLNFIYRPEYQRNSVTSAIKYSWVQFDKNISHTFALTEVNFIQSDLTEGYGNFLDSLAREGNNLIQSFRSALVTSIWYSPTYNFNDYGNPKTPSSYLKYKLELGGNSERIYKEIALNRSIEIYQYAKINVDFRQVRPINSIFSLAGRANVGVAIPYGDNESLPYEKFYFAGGSNGIRAWTPRRLGPGSYLPLDSVTYDNRYEQPGEILIETSIELRHKLFSFIHGAFFLDAGNVWRIRNDPARPGGQFKFDKFINDIAIGGGYGIRFDLSFLLLRLDAAWKLRDPAIDTATGRIDRNPFDIPSYGGYSKLVWNIGIGYPF